MRIPWKTNSCRVKACFNGRQLSQLLLYFTIETSITSKPADGKESRRKEAAEVRARGKRMEHKKKRRQGQVDAAGGSSRGSSRGGADRKIASRGGKPVCTPACSGLPPRASKALNTQICK